MAVLANPLGAIQVLDASAAVVGRLRRTTVTSADSEAGTACFPDGAYDKVHATTTIRDPNTHELCQVDITCDGECQNGHWALIGTGCVINHMECGTDQTATSTILEP